MCFLHYIYSIGNQQIGVIPSSRLLVWAAPGGLQPESSPLSRPWSSQPCQKDAGRLLLPTQVCWGSELWCAAPPRCSKDGWSSSGFDQHLSPSEKTFFFFLWLIQLSHFSMHLWTQVKLSKLSTSHKLLSHTLDTVTGFRQVCPPPVKLHITSMVSAAQPRFGSIQ